STEACAPDAIRSNRPPPSGIRMPHRSRDLFLRARTLIPGGVNSPVRAFTAVGGSPPVIAPGEGSRIWDEDGREYLDFLGSWGPLILGHAPPEVLAALQETMQRGCSFGAPTALEVDLAEELEKAIPSLQQVRE